MLAGFDDGRADEGVGAAGATLEGLKVARAARLGGRGPVRREVQQQQRFWRSAGLGAVAGRADRRGPRRRPGRAERARRRRRGPDADERRASARTEAEGRLTWPASTTELTPILTEFWDDPQSWTLETYERTTATPRCARPWAWRRPTWSQAVKDSGLRGRGGAGFPTGMKWSFMPPHDGGPRYLVVNADESEPGTCKDIPLMMATPQFLIEGMIITSYAIGCKHAFIYVRGEVVHVYRRLLRAVEEAKAKGYLGENILGSGYDLEITVHAGAGAYICGEETALLDSLEGRRGQPRLKPPFPAVAGLYARPTVVNNVESIASVPCIVAQGRRLVRRDGHREVHGLRPLQPLRPRRPGPASTRRRWASRCASCSTWPAASAAARR